MDSPLSYTKSLTARYQTTYQRIKDLKLGFICDILLTITKIFQMLRCSFTVDQKITTRIG